MTGTTSTTLTRMVHWLAAARATADADLADRLDDIEVTVYEATGGVEPTTALPDPLHDPLTCVQHAIDALDAIPTTDRELWMLPLRVELALIVRPR